MPVPLRVLGRTVFLGYTLRRRQVTSLRKSIGFYTRATMPKRKAAGSAFQGAEKFKGMHVLSTTQFDETMLRFVFETASAMKRMVQEKRKSDVLRGRILANVFFEPKMSVTCVEKH